ncbi:unnamed protein product [Toxocara canis]|uniref:Uncharacterized protein n=1 Tax=Toxocara canis TaxID=6265 RepID=A0A183UB54_TOXCA|nr:unnamed protein product [Toxocara canis]
MTATRYFYSWTANGKWTMLFDTFCGVNLGRAEAVVWIFDSEKARCQFIRSFMMVDGPAVMNFMEPQRAFERFVRRCNAWQLDINVEERCSLHTGRVLEDPLRLSAFRLLLPVPSTTCECSLTNRCIGRLISSQ